MNSEEEIIIKFEGDLDNSENIFFKKNNAIIGRSQSLIGGEPIIEILLVISTPILIKSLRDIIIKRIDSKKNTSIKINGIEAKNIDKETLNKILKKFYSSEENQ